MKEYEELGNQHSEGLKNLTKKYNLISGVRLLFALAFGLNLYFYIQPGNPFLIIPLVVLAVAFLLAVREHQKISWQKKLKQTLITINENEVKHLKGQEVPFENGKEFIDSSHTYSYDLDFFGEHSFFHNLNRTATRMGNRQLASSLLSFLPQKEILRTQVAIKELEPKVDWRQEILALGRIKPDSDESYAALRKWTYKESSEVPKLILFISYFVPALLAISLMTYALSPSEIFGNVSFLLFLINLAVVGTQAKKIQAEIIDSSEIDKILRQYSMIMEKIENESFECSRLQGLSAQLRLGNSTASSKVERLSGLFTRMDHVQNFVAGLVNGFFPFHIHTLAALIRWREEFAKHISKWLDTIGEMEALNSLANFAHNNPGFAYPQLNQDQRVSFANLGHPLINSEIRVNNHVTFEPQNFFILTGSNMSGKSTFLRTLGINMVLTSIGAPVCASDANVHPIPVLVSMRLSDSLNDSESYFFAEVKRLKKIMKSLDNAISFVLLDEILRGTNSDDKRSGTIEVIRKMVEKNAIGAIATHDLEVCKTATEHPEKLSNICFEVEIVDNELEFDYKLRHGICKNKSATFLMEKMGVI